MFNERKVKARISFIVVLAFMFSLILPVLIGEQVAMASNIQPISNLKVGDKVVDPSWDWHFRTGENYTYEKDDKTKPVIWIVAAKNHYSEHDPHVTLISEELIGLYTFDNSIKHFI